MCKTKDARNVFRYFQAYQKVVGVQFTIGDKAIQLMAACRKNGFGMRAFDDFTTATAGGTATPPLEYHHECQE